MLQKLNKKWKYFVNVFLKGGLIKKNLIFHGLLGLFFYIDMKGQQIIQKY